MAFALHEMPDANGPNGVVGYSEVFAGRFDRNRLTKWLDAHAIGKEEYDGRTIYSMPSEGRLVRVAVLGYDMVGASNMPSTDQIHSILDRQRAAASPFPGSSLLNTRYAEVPAFSEAWAIGRIGLPFGKEGKINAMGVELPLPEDTTFVASLRFTTALHLRIDEITASDEDAERSARALNGLLVMARAIQHGQQGASPTPEAKALLEFADSVAIAQKKDRVELTATVPTAALQGIGTP